MHWTCTKISASAVIPDATLLEILLDKVSFFSSLCFSFSSEKLMIIRIFHGIQHITNNSYSVNFNINF